MDIRIADNSLKDAHNHWPEKLTGALLAFVGLGFLLLLTILELRGDLKGDLKISGFMLCVGSMLMWVGINFARPTPSVSRSRRNGALAHPAKIRLALQLTAAAGSLLLLGRMISIPKAFLWPPEPWFKAVLAVPVGIGLLIPRTLSARPEEPAETWPTGLRRLVRILLRLSSLGYLAIAALWLGLDGRATQAWRQTVQLLACFFILLLYGSQILMLHFWRNREIRKES